MLVAHPRGVGPMEGAGPVVAAPLSQARVVSRILSHSSAVVDETLCQIKFASKLYVWVKEMLTAGTEQSALVRRLLGLCQAGVEGVDGLVDRAVERAGFAIMDKSDLARQLALSGRSEEEWCELQEAFFEATREGNVNQKMWRAAMREKAGLEKKLEALEAANRELVAARAKLKAELIAATERLAEMEGAVKVREATLRAEMESRNESLRKQVDELDGDLTREREHVGNLRRQQDSSFSCLRSEVESLKKEREALVSRCQTLQMQLTEVEDFLPTNRGIAFQDLENELAMSKLRTAELEQDKDDLLERLSSVENAMHAGNVKSTMRAMF